MTNTFRDPNGTLREHGGEFAAETHSPAAVALAFAPAPGEIVASFNDEEAGPVRIVASDEGAGVYEFQAFDGNVTFDVEEDDATVDEIRVAGAAAYDADVYGQRGLGLYDLTANDRDDLIDGYLASMLWTATDEEGNELGKGRTTADFTDEAVASAKEDLDGFVAGNWGLVQRYLTEGRSYADLGHDFNLTRNGHGVNFRDRGLGELGEHLADMARPAGGVFVYVGDDGKLHSQG
ncbi:hypothetical protein [Agromyces humi]|uniref:hypothetical protein n=1 Tax=Agromyces humi TaxID=1766800 RepID=UPI001357C805|nr:hypothetical protein [Agromyces humi]